MLFNRKANRKANRNLSLWSCLPEVLENRQMMSATPTPWLGLAMTPVAASQPGAAEHVAQAVVSRGVTRKLPKPSRPALSAAIVSAGPVTQLSAPEEPIVVRYADTAKIKLASIGTQNLSVAGGLDVTNATYIANKAHTSVTATYTVAPSVGAGWTPNSINWLQIENVIDSRGRRVQALAGNFQVTASATPTPQPNPVINNPQITGVTGAATLVASIGHQYITISGSGFEDGLTLKFRDPSGNLTDETQYVPATVSSTQFTVQVPLIDVAGNWTAEVVNPNGGDSGQFTFSVQQPTPVVSNPQITAVTGTAPLVASIGHQYITISGSGFEDGLTLKFRDPSGNLTDETEYVPPTVSSTQFTVQVPFIDTAGNWTAEVVNPNGGDSGPFTFSVQQPTPVVSNPQITGVTGNAPLMANIGHQVINITGSGFDNGLTLKFRDPLGNLTDETQYVPPTVSSTQFTVQVPFIDTAGNWTAEVVNPNGGDSGQFTFNVQQPTPVVSNPQITGVTGNAPLVANIGHQVINITGSGFDNGLTLKFRDPSGNLTDETQYVPPTVSSTQFTVQVPLIDVAGNWTAEVVNPNGGDSGQFTFSVQQPTPVVSNPQITAVTGTAPLVASIGHQYITISGSGFEDGLTLKFRDPSGNLTDETEYVPPTVSSTQFTVQVPFIDTAGNWTAEVVNPNGGDSGQFTFNVSAT